MARRVQVVCLDGKQYTQDETRVDYFVGIPSNILFFFIGTIQYALWWGIGIPPQLVKVSVSQILSID